MQDNIQPIIGLDLGTASVKVVAATIDQDRNVSIVGVSKVASSGMRKGTIDKLDSVAKAIDDALGEAERMAGLEINRATISINGSNVMSNEVDGMVAISGQEVDVNDLARIEGVATLGKIPANRELLSVVPHDYSIDGQGGIKNPLGMVGSRLEIKANVVSALSPNVQNIVKVCDMTQVEVNNIINSSIAAAKAVLSENQLENGVALIDFGAATTGISIFEEGDLRFTAVIPYGSHNLTNDLAIGLKTTPEVAEKIKLEYGDAASTQGDKQVALKVDNKNHKFNLKDVDEIVEARLDEIFDLVIAKMKESGYYGKLPNGVVLSGGGAKLKNMVDFVQSKLELSTSLAKLPKVSGLVDKVNDLELVTALGLALADQNSANHNFNNKPTKSFLGKIFKFFK